MKLLIIFFFIKKKKRKKKNFLRIRNLVSFKLQATILRSQLYRTKLQRMLFINNFCYYSVSWLISLLVHKSEFWVLKWFWKV